MALVRLVGFFEDSPAGFRRLILLLYGLAVPQLAILVWFIAAPEFRQLSTLSETGLIIALIFGLVQGTAAWLAFNQSRRLSAHLTVLQRDMHERDAANREAAEVALRRSEARYRNMVANASLPLAVVSITTNHVLFANDKALTLFEVDADHLATYRAEDFWLNPDDGVRFRELIHRTRHVTGFEMQTRGARGTPRWLTISASVIEFEGEPATLNIFTDVTAEHDVAAALAKEHLRLDRIIEGTNVGTWEWNVQTGEASFSDRWIEMLGYRREELEPISIRTWEHLAHPEDLARSTELLEAHFRGDAPFYEMEGRMRHKDGHWLWVLDRGKVATRTPDGRPLLMMGTHQDISERKATEAELQEAHQRFEKIFRHNPALMAISSMPNRRFVDINEAFLRTLGYAREEVIGRTSAELGLTPAPDRHTRITSTLTQTGHIEGREMPVRRKDGSVLTGVFSGELLTIQDRQELLTVMIDVTEQQKAEAAVRELAERAEAASRAKSDFLANMSHELRTPMNGIIGMAGLLLDSNLDTEQRRHAEALRHSGESLLTLINDILDISKIESGRFELETVDFELAKVIADCRELLSDRLQRKGLTCNCEIADDVPPMLLGDAGRLRQIFLNLLDNGVKFTERGSVDARISVERRTADRVVLRCAVRDTGIGIPADKMPMLFKTFSQGNASISRRFGGTGLGLAISKQLAERMGGDIGVSSEAGRGSEFWFTVEMGIGTAAARDVSVSASTAPPTFDGRKARILVAEDNATNQLVALGLLRKMGLSADAVADGAEAVRAVATVPYDLVLMDVQMPDVDGLEATRQIRAAESGGRRIPIIAMTAHAMQGDRERCLASGMDDYLAKPVSPQQLGDTLRQWLPTPTDVAGIQRAHAERADAQHGAPRVFDRDGMLNRVLDDEDAARHVARSFLDDLPKRIDALGERLAAGALDDVERQAHTIKGAAATIGGESMRTVALGIEGAARDGNLAAAQHLHRALHEEFEKLRTALQSAFTL